MNVLSLFDGMSCGQIALNRCGIKYKNYHASEVDKYAIQVTQTNYPDTIQLGDIRNVYAKDLPKIDLLIGGSPCQGFSFAGNGLNFEDERSKLFFEYVRMLKECQPKYFLLENVKMKKEYEQRINRILGCRPLRLNSALVSAQNRQRLYWTNIRVMDAPKDKRILLRNVLENECVINNNGNLKIIEKSTCIDANYFKGMDNHGQRTMVRSINPKTDGVQTHQTSRAYDSDGKMTSLLSGATGRHNVYDGDVRKLTPLECERLQTVPDNYTSCVSNSQRYKMLGNGWTVDIICHIFKYLKINT